MSFLLTIAITAFLSYPDCVNGDGGSPPTADSVTNFATWATYEHVCETPDISNPSSPPLKPKAACEKAASDGYTDDDGTHDADDTWDDMCTALAEFDCTGDKDGREAKDDVAMFTACCTDSTSDDGCLKVTTPAIQQTYETQASCCAACITGSQTTTPTTHAPTTSPSAPGPTTTPSGKPTTVAPGPGPTTSPSSPSETETTTGPSESTENVTEPDSAFPLGPSGLLVTLFAMMAAVVNIA